MFDPRQKLNDYTEYHRENNFFPWISLLLPHINIPIR